MANEKFANALRRQGGMWGSAWRDGVMLTDVVEVSGTTSVGRIDIPLVGQTTVGHKPGRRSSEGSISFQKVDSEWEMQVYRAFTMDVDTLRAARDAGDFSDLGSFDLLLKNDDPHAFGKEVWQLQGCQIWQMDVGMNIGEDFISRQIPLTYELAVPIRTFAVVDGQVRVTTDLQA
jgi:hypothetical protein